MNYFKEKTMKKQTLTRLLSFLLVALMMVSVFAACGKKDNGDKPGGEVDIPTVDDGPKNPNIPKQDYDGYEFTIITQPFLAANAYSYDWMVSDGENSTTLMDAVYRRNAFVEDKHNIKIGVMKVSDIITSVRQQIMGGVVEFDMIISSCSFLASIARENLLLDLNTVERFALTESYWDKNAKEQLEIAGKLFFTNSAFLVQEVGFAVYFNKYLIDEYKLTSPYEYMKNNEWTIDNWAKLCMSVSKDVNADGQLTPVDLHGTLVEHHNPRMFFYGAGCRATTNDDNGYPRLSVFDTDKPVTIYEKCKEVFSSSYATVIEDMPSKDTHGYADVWDYARSLFCQDLYLFHYEGTNIIHQFAEMEHEFGVVPFPKYDSNQKEYYTYYPLNCVMMAVPNIVENMDRTANIIEDLNYYSEVILKPAWFDTLLARRYVRDDESEESLRILLEGRVYDIGLYYNFGGYLRTGVLDIDCRKLNISTNFNRYKKAIEADIAKMHGNFLMGAQ